MNCPVSHLLFSDAKSSTTSATSSTEPTLSSALVSGTSAECMASSTCGGKLPVGTGPGATVLMVMPYPRPNYGSIRMSVSTLFARSLL